MFKRYHETVASSKASTSGQMQGYEDGTKTLVVTTLCQGRNQPHTTPRSPEGGNEVRNDEKKINCNAIFNNKNHCKAASSPPPEVDSKGQWVGASNSTSQSIVRIDNWVHHCYTSNSLCAVQGKHFLSTVSLVNSQACAIESTNIWPNTDGEMAITSASRLRCRFMSSYLLVVYLRKSEHHLPDNSAFHHHHYY